MAVSPKNVDIKLIKQFSPFDTLGLSKIEEILAKSAIQKVPAGKMLFKEGDRDKWTVYLLAGELELSSSQHSSQVLLAGDKNALKQISHGIPRVFTATAKTDVSVLIIDTGLFNAIINSRSSNSITVSDFGSDEEDDDDWMTKFLQSGAFIQLPAANMQALLIKLEEVPLSKGKMVIREGDLEDQNYYIIKQGQCIVSRKDPKTGKQKPLAILKSGVGFGEEALITETCRGATVSMKSDGVVLKLPKHDFIELLVKPTIHIQSQSEIDELIKEGYDVTYIDVRSKAEHQANGLPNSLHCPIRDIRDFFNSLDPESHYVMYSNTEHRSSSAAFLFIQQNFEVSVLKGGVGNSEASTTTTTTTASSEQAPVEEDKNDEAKDISFYQEELKKMEVDRQLTNAARLQAEAMVTKLKKELINAKELAQKEARIAKNAMTLLRQAEEKLKKLS